MTQYEVGQQVAVDLGGYKQEWYIGTVARITPTGWVVVSIGARGYTYKPDRRGIYPPELSAVTPKIAEAVERRRLLYSIGAVKWKDVPTEMLRTIMEVLKASEQPAD